MCSCCRDNAAPAAPACLPATKGQDENIEIRMVDSGSSGGGGGSCGWGERRCALIFAPYGFSNDVSGGMNKKRTLWRFVFCYFLSSKHPYHELDIVGADGKGKSQVTLNYSLEALYSSMEL